MLLLDWSFCSESNFYLPIFVLSSVGFFDVLGLFAFLILFVLPLSPFPLHSLGYAYDLSANVIYLFFGVLIFFHFLI